MSAVIDQFGAEYYVLNGISPKRQREQTAVLRRFDEWLGETPLLSVAPADVRKWMAEQREAGLEPNTTRKHLMMFRSFWKWAREAGLLTAIEYAELCEIKSPRGSSPRTTPRPYTMKEVRQLWRDIAAKHPLLNEGQYRRWLRRNRPEVKRYPPWRLTFHHGYRLQLEAIVSLALYCGLRQNEIFTLSLEDLHPDNRYIPVKGKADPATGRVKGREVPYSDAAREAVTRWLEFRRALFIKTHRSVWVTLRGTRVRQPMYWTQFHSLLAHVGKGYGLHRLRHTCATERLRAGMTLESLMRFLGHSNLQQTLMYAQILASDVHKAAEATEADFMKAVGKRAA